MKTLIHDLENQDYQKYFSKLNSNNIKVISNQQPIHNCIGCFACWVKTPGTCIIRDDFGDMDRQPVLAGGNLPKKTD